MLLTHKRVIVSASIMLVIKIFLLSFFMNVKIPARTLRTVRKGGKNRAPIKKSTTPYGNTLLREDIRENNSEPTFQSKIQIRLNIVTIQKKIRLGFCSILFEGFDCLYVCWSAHVGPAGLRFI